MGEEKKRIQKNNRIFNQKEEKIQQKIKNYYRTFLNHSFV